MATALIPASSLLLATTSSTALPPSSTISTALPPCSTISSIPVRAIPVPNSNKLILAAPCILLRAATVAQQVQALRQKKLILAASALPPAAAPTTSPVPIAASLSPPASATGTAAVPEALRCKRRADLGRLGLPEAKPLSVSRRNARERNRVKLVNQGFETLREHVPNGRKNKKMSKVDTLRSAVEYIRLMQQMIREHDEKLGILSSVGRAPEEQVLGKGFSALVEEEDDSCDMTVDSPASPDTSLSSTPGDSASEDTGSAHNSSATFREEDTMTDISAINTDSINNNNNNEAVDCNSKTVNGGRRLHPSGNSQAEAPILCNAAPVFNKFSCSSFMSASSFITPTFVASSSFVTSPSMSSPATITVITLPLQQCSTATSFLPAETVSSAPLTPCSVAPTPAGKSAGLAPATSIRLTTLQGLGSLSGQGLTTIRPSCPPVAQQQQQHETQVQQITFTVLPAVKAPPLDQVNGRLKAGLSSIAGHQGTPLSPPAQFALLRHGSLHHTPISQTDVVGRVIAPRPPKDTALLSMLSAPTDANVSPAAVSSHNTASLLQTFTDIYQALAPSSKATTAAEEANKASSPDRSCCGSVTSDNSYQSLGSLDEDLRDLSDWITELCNSEQDFRCHSDPNDDCMSHELTTGSYGP